MFLIRRLTVFRRLQHAACCLSAAFLIAACGGGSGGVDSQPEGRLSFQVQWDRQLVPEDDPVRYGVDDCSDVDTVSAAVYDSNGGLLQTGGPWSCGEGQGSITQVPADRYVRVAVVGLSEAGLARYRGESGETLYLPGGGSVDAGLIVAPAFLASLTTPEDGAEVAPSALTLAWSAVSGAESYVVEIASDAGFGAATVIQTLTVDASANPFCRPDASGLSEETVYFWRVQVVDSAGNTSEPSGYRYFYVNRNLMSVIISVPLNNSVVQLGDSVSFNADVTDPDGAPLTADDLTLIQWSSTLDGQLSDQLAFSTSALSAGSHTITMSVEDADGLYGSATVSVRVNQPPVADMVVPAAEYSHSLYYPLTCQGTGVDPEDGALTGTSLQWQLFAPDDPVNPSWSGSGETPYIDYMYFDGSGTYTITLQVTDSDGASTVMSRDFDVSGGEG